MICYANENDFEEIFVLWKKCFFDSDDFNNWYFNNIYDFKNTILYKKNNNICAMLQNIPYKFNNMGNVSYIYGACTLPHMRKNGLMRELINFTFEQDKINKINASILIPQNRQLFDFYSKFGYKSTVFVEKALIEKNVLFLDNSINENLYYFDTIKCSYSDINQINKIYNSQFDGFDFIIRDSNYWEIQIKMFKSLGGNVYCIKEKNSNIIKAYCFVWNEQHLWAQEIFSISKHYENILLKSIMDFYCKQKIYINKLIKNKKCLPKACIKIYNNINHINYENYFFNLMFD